MDFVEGGLFCRAKSIVSSLYGIMLWTPTSPSSIQQYFPKEWLTCPGLKSLFSPHQGPQNPTDHSCCVIHSYMILPSLRVLPPPTNSSSHSSWSSALLDDLIGTESGVCMNPKFEEETVLKLEKVEEAYHYQGRRKQSYATRRNKLYPPPIPLLARTGNLPGHMPWVLSRHYIDGKLVLIEERVKHHEYFEAHRENGRLVLNLVPLDDKVTCSHFVSEPNEQKQQELQDLDFTEEATEMLTERIAEEDVEGGSGGSTEAYDQEIELTIDDDDVEKLVTSLASLPRSSLKNGSTETSGDLHKGFISYGGRIPCKANAHRSASACMNIHTSTSASLDFSNVHHPLTTVV